MASRRDGRAGVDGSGGGDLTRVLRLGPGCGPHTPVVGGSTEGEWIRRPHQWRERLPQEHHLTFFKAKKVKAML